MCVCACACVRVRACVCVCVNNIVQYGPTGNQHKDMRIISDFAREINEICALLAYYAVYSADFLPTFRDNCREMSVRNQHHALRNIPEERRSHQNMCSK